MLLTGAKLDAKLAEIGSGGGSKAFSRSMALRRWHGKIGPWANVSYRLELWRVRPSEASTFLLTLIILDSNCTMRQAHRPLMDLLVHAGRLTTAI